MKPAKKQFVAPQLVEESTLGDLTRGGFQLISGGGGGGDDDA
jgi:hypothetical protein